MDRLIDARDMIVGRIATVAAREVLHGKTVHVVNCENALFSGRKKMNIDDWKNQQARGVPKKGPFINSQPDQFVKRIIRGMLPKNARGRDALTRVRCHIGNPDVKAEQIQIVNADKEKLPNSKYVSVGRICKELGWKGESA